jgi:hypothetical protein
VPTPAPAPPSPYQTGDYTDLNFLIPETIDNGMWKANAYVVKYALNLFNNFTWFTTNPTLGDQFHQSDDRIYSGGAVSRTFNGTLFFAEPDGGRAANP